VNNDLIADKAKVHLKRILELIGIDADIEVINRRGGTVLDILAGEENALIIGRNGQNLDALQYLINRMVTGGSREVTPIAIDAEGYREKRISKLEDLAHRTASRVLRHRRDIELEPMSAADRKVIHMALKGTRGVHTISRGEDLDRSVVVTYGSGDMSNSSRERDQGRGRGRDRERQGGRPHGTTPTPRILDENDPDYDDNFGNR
jgi:spoIIIJ-associated protein